MNTASLRLAASSSASVLARRGGRSQLVAVAGTQVGARGMSDLVGTWKEKQHAIEEQYFAKLDKEQRANFANKLHT